MSWFLARIARWPSTLALTLIFLAVPATTSHAQYMGYGGYGYGYPGYGMGFGYPGAMGGYGYPGMGYGGMGYGGMGYGGMGYGGMGYGGYGYGGFGYGGPGVNVGSGYLPYSYPVGGPGPGAYNPLFGVGLSPLGVNSALTERYMLGRGTTQYRRGYGPPTAVPGPVQSQVAPGPR